MKECLFSLGDSERVQLVCGGGGECHGILKIQVQSVNGAQESLGQHVPLHPCLHTCLLSFSDEVLVTH